MTKDNVNNKLDYQIVDNLPLHISYSAMSTYIDCGQKYFLTRVQNVAEQPGWYSVGGSAVHEATEIYDRLQENEQASFDPTQTFSESFKKFTAQAVEFSGVEPSGFKAGGRVSKAWPNKEDAAWWVENGPVMVQRWVDWRKGCGWKIWDPEDDGVLAVELGIDYKLDDGVHVKMFIDRVMVTPDGEMVVVDLKSGARTPSADLQLAVYAAGIERRWGIRPSYGTYWMAREGVTSQLASLDYLPSDRVHAIVSQFDKARKAGIFIPNLNNCHYCSVAQHCDWSKK